MKVQELIEKLQKLDPELIVVTSESSDKDEEWCMEYEDMNSTFKRTYWQIEGLSIVKQDYKYYDERAQSQEGNVVEIFT